MPARPVAQNAWPGTTSTGSTGAWAYFGEGMTKLTAWITNPTTNALSAAIEVSAGGSTGSVTLLAASDSTGANLVRSATSTDMFDKARVVVGANETTGNASIWLLAAP